jgi:hypothetical protein
MEYKIKLPKETARNLPYWVVRIEGDRLIPIRECASLFTALNGATGTSPEIKVGQGVIERRGGEWYLVRIYQNPTLCKRASKGSLPVIRAIMTSSSPSNLY